MVNIYIIYGVCVHVSVCIDIYGSRCTIFIYFIHRAILLYPYKSI